MAEYIQIQTYAQADAETFPEIVRRYRVIIEKFGIDDARVLEWLQSLTWPVSEEEGFGDIYASSFVLSPHSQYPIRSTGMDVTLHTITPVQSMEDIPPWVGFNLLFEEDDLRIGTSSVYKPSIGGILWRVMRELAPIFNEVGVYLTDEWQENRSWRAVAEDEGEPWSFDLAIFPRELAEHFSSVPAGFQGTVIPQGFGFAQSNRWQRLPWLEADLQ
jgi:hypothetical protein